MTTLINIQIGDLDFENRLITLRKTKNKKQQILPLSNTIIPILKEYLMYRKAKSTGDYLFINSFGDKLDKRSLERNLASYNKKRGVMKKGLHIFRNVYAKKWILSGGDIFRLQKILGHSDLKMVKEYVEMFSNDIQQDFDKFNALDQLTDSREYVKLRK